MSPSLLTGQRPGQRHHHRHLHRQLGPGGRRAKRVAGRSRHGGQRGDHRRQQRGRAELRGRRRVGGGMKVGGGMALLLAIATPPAGWMVGGFLVLWTLYAFVSGIVAVPYNDIVGRAIPSAALRADSIAFTVCA